MDQALATSPLRLLSPKNHGHGAWTFVATLGGGLVAGDFIDLTVRVGRGATAFVGTQSQTKVYRGSSRQRLSVLVEAEGVAVFVPDPVACFRGSSYEQETEIRLGENSSLLWVDGITCGRDAYGERWAFDSYRTRTIVFRGGRPAVIDALLLDRTCGDLPARMFRFGAFATLVALGPAFEAMSSDWLAQVPLQPSRNQRPELISAASPLEAKGAIVRVAASSVERALHFTRERLGHLKVVLGDDPLARKW